MKVPNHLQRILRKDDRNFWVIPKCSDIDYSMGVLSVTLHSKIEAGNNSIEVFKMSDIVQKRLKSISPVRSVKERHLFTALLLLVYLQQTFVQKTSCLRMFPFILKYRFSMTA